MEISDTVPAPPNATLSHFRHIVRVMNGNGKADPSTAIVERNRRNAQLSTGPRTARGKAIARRNAVKHGLTASDPTAVGIEDEALYREMHEQLREDLQPRNLIEDGLVHRIAVAMWRLSRAARIDGAYSSLRTERAHGPDERELEWIETFNRCWRWKRVKIRDKKVLIQAFKAGLAELDEDYWERLQRPDLRLLDGLAREMLQDRAGIGALWTMLTHLWGRYQHEVPINWRAEEVEKIAFLLGDSAETFPVNYNEHRHGCHNPPRAYTEIGEHPTKPGPAQEMLWEWIEDEEGKPERYAAVESAVRAALDSLEQQRLAASEIDETEEREWECQQSLLPEPEMLDRLIRYETHAERSMYRALEALARLRGESVQILMARINYHETRHGEG